MSSGKIEQTEENPILVSNEIRMKDNDNAEEDEKKRAIENEEKEMTDNASHTFPITVLDLEDLMGKYKERGADCLDLKAIESLGGIETLLQKLKTDPKKGIQSIDFREQDFGSNKVFVEPVPPFCAYVCIVNILWILKKEKNISIGYCRQLQRRLQEIHFTQL